MSELLEEEVDDDVLKVSQMPDLAIEVLSPKQSKSLLTSQAISYVGNKNLLPTLRLIAIKYYIY